MDVIYLVLDEINEHMYAHGVRPNGEILLLNMNWTKIIKVLPKFITTGSTHISYIKGVTVPCMVIHNPLWIKIVSLWS